MSFELDGTHDVKGAETRRTETHASAEGVSGEPATNATQSPPAPDRAPMRRRKLLLAVLGAAGLVVVCVFGIPWIRVAFTTVSTDDAYVNGHVTFVAPRIGGQISRVLVDDNNHVHKGDLLAELDKEPYRIAVSQKQAAVDTAEADLQAA